VRNRSHLENHGNLQVEWQNVVEIKNICVVCND